MTSSTKEQVHNISQLDFLQTRHPSWHLIYSGKVLKMSLYSIQINS